MTIELKIPSPGESITEVELASWFVENGDTVQKDQEIGELESEKASLPLIAEDAGKVELLAEPGDTLKVGDVVCKIDTSVKPDKKEEPTKEKKETKEKPSEDKKSTPESSEGKSEKSETKKTEEKAVQPKEENEAVKVTPVARKIMQENGFSVDDIINGLRKITSDDVKAVKEQGGDASATRGLLKKETSRDVSRSPMSQLRKKISERLVAVKNETAMLTTFNETDMSKVMQLREKHQDKFVEKYGLKLGFMSFFTKAVTVALQQFPYVNSYIDGDEIVTPHYCDVGIAVQTGKGLMVPVIRNTETLSLADIEKQILDIAGRARKNRISLDELSGGTFTITNGGVFGSMLSTPILNPPQSGILGMHNIIERPVAINGKVEIRPMMYIALSYDHRVIDGKDSVGFLKTVKEIIENPVSMLFGGNEPENMLLGL
ncbi:MAG TPA: 2-oxoglutarate dehydrogenase complex dihydrolipoyllysine-residue succinyltransferase [Bacteroidales bacterium]|nr:2-oxoglutarate dehydrogenase complex dihydrolipoyllysine-residue succinyltransferase [Bacteroidales bacterium]